MRLPGVRTQDFTYCVDTYFCSFSFELLRSSDLDFQKRQKKNPNPTNPDQKGKGFLKIFGHICPRKLAQPLGNVHSSQLCTADPQHKSYSPGLISRKASHQNVYISGPSGGFDEYSSSCIAKYLRNLSVLESHL